MALVAISTVRGADIVHDGGLDVFGGVTTIRRSSELLALTVALAVMTVAWGGWMVLIVLYALSPDLLALSASGLGVIMAALGFGGLAGALGYNRLKAWLGMRLLLALDAIGTVIFLIVPALGGGFVMTVIAAFVAGIGGVTWAVAIGAYQQATIAPGQLGRSVAAYRWFGWSGFFVGSLAAGLLAEQAGTMVALAVFTVIAAAFLLAFPFLLGRGKMHNIELSLGMRDGEMAAASG
jgi:MFS family permease